MLDAYLPEFGQMSQALRGRSGQALPRGRHRVGVIIYPVISKHYPPPLSGRGSFGAKRY
jgi:hypothetical protein